ncbi:hypothetical protein BJ944DRAFT_273798 [Cunninghamella echinulata]|nr:hypothetical protein BJ944DRAFT_273798 [Cunninghamella echinulata]
MAFNHPLVISTSSTRSNKPSGSWLLANNSSLAFSSFFTDIQPNHSNEIQSTKTTTDHQYRTKINKKIQPNNNNNSSQKNNEKNIKNNKSPVKNHDKKEISKDIVKKDPPANTFDSEFPVLLADLPPPKTIDSIQPTITTKAKPELIDSSMLRQKKHVWSNTQMIKHNVLSPSKSPVNEYDDPNNNNVNNVSNMEMERLKALVPKRRSQVQTSAAAHYISNTNNHHHQRGRSTPTSSISTSLNNANNNNNNNNSRLSPSSSSSSKLFTLKKSKNHHHDQHNINNHYHNRNNSSDNSYNSNSNINDVSNEKSTNPVLFTSNYDNNNESLINSNTENRIDGTKIQTSLSPKNDQKKQTIELATSNKSSKITPTSTTTVINVSKENNSHNTSVVTEQDQMRFFLFLKRWTGSYIINHNYNSNSININNSDENDWGKKRYFDTLTTQPVTSNIPLPIGTQR